nr:MAG TPA: hypothetical protein [Caudoviricetes sp.]
MMRTTKIYHPERVVFYAQKLIVNNTVSMW